MPVERDRNRNQASLPGYPHGSSDYLLMAPVDPVEEPDGNGRGASVKGK
jgi:hypothetical protein